MTEQRKLCPDNTILVCSNCKYTTTALQARMRVFRANQCARCNAPYSLIPVTVKPAERLGGDSDD